MTIRLLAPRSSLARGLAMWLFFLEYNHAALPGPSNVRLRYQFTEATALYVVCNDRLNTDRTRLMPQGRSCRCPGGGPCW